MQKLITGKILKGALFAHGEEHQGNFFITGKLKLNLLQR